jgi:glycine oxidase
VVDCRGLSARGELGELRGVRGERLIVRSRELGFARPVRLLHPRQPIYVVPWGDGLFMIGATAIESDDAGPVAVRSALDLLGMAYALHPAFGEAEIVELGAGVRPAFPDNVPKIVVRGKTLFVNGLYRHGFLLAPALAELAAAYLETGTIDNRVFLVDG